MDTELEEIVNSIDDVTEPSSLDKILIYLEDIEAEDDDFMQLLVQKLENEVVYWEHPWYQSTEYSLTRPFHHVLENGEEYRTDTICFEEAEIVQKNWNKFMQEYGVPDKLISFARWKNKSNHSRKSVEEITRRHVTAYLARGLKRNLYQVFKYISLRLGNKKKANYSEIEEKIMEICFHHRPTHVCSIVSKVLGRESRGIYKRLDQLCNGKPEKKKLKWDLPLATTFLNSLLKYTGLPLQELKYKKIDNSVWLKLGDDMDHLHVYLQRFWYTYLHVQLFVKYDVKLYKLRKKIINILKSSQYKVWSDIRWKEVQKQCRDGFTHLFLYKMFFRLIGKKRDYQKIPLQELLTYLNNRLKSNTRFHNKRLKTLTLNKKGNLIITKYSKDD